MGEEEEEGEVDSWLRHTAAHVPPGLVAASLLVSLVGIDRRTDRYSANTRLRFQLVRGKRSSSMMVLSGGVFGQWR